MSIKYHLAILLLTVVTGQAYAEVYKCSSPSGGIAFQATPCSDESTETVLDIKTYSSKNSGNSDPADITVVGSWSSANSIYRPTFLASGSMYILDNRGDTLRGKWEEVGDNKYTVDAAFNGDSFPVSMRMDVETGELIMSVAGLGSKRYQKR